MLAALNGSHPGGEFAHAGSQGGDIAGRAIPLGRLLQIPQFGAGLGEHGLGIQAGAVRGLAQTVAGRQLAAHVRYHQTQGIADRLAGFDLAQGRDRLTKLAAVGSEAEHQPWPRVVERHGGQVGGMQLPKNEVGRRFLGAADRVGS